jgi:luciferase family oxidoreductase group 1
LADTTLKLSVVDQSPVPSGSTPADALRNTIDLARLADRLGYERYWLAEHHATAGFAGSAPEILIARIGAETSGIRVGSGGVMLPHYSPLKVAEVFRTLHALYPGRVDLGIGRAPGGTPLETLALRRERDRRPLPDDFPEQLAELEAFLGYDAFPGDHPFGRIEVSPATPGGPEVWLLGSSMWSSAAAAQLGLPYAFAHFIDPTPTRAAVENYRYNVTAMRSGDRPRAILAVGAIAADTEQEARRLSQSLRLFRKLLVEGGKLGRIATPEEAIARLGSGGGPSFDRSSEWPRVVVGATEQVRDTLATMATELGVDEITIVTVVHDHAARRRSYELLAEAFGLAPRATEPALAPEVAV